MITFVNSIDRARGAVHATLSFFGVTPVIPSGTMACEFHVPARTTFDVPARTEFIVPKRTEFKVGC